MFNSPSLAFVVGVLLGVVLGMTIIIVVLVVALKGRFARATIDFEPEKDEQQDDRASGQMERDEERSYLEGRLQSLYDMIPVENPTTHEVADADWWKKQNEPPADLDTAWIEQYARREMRNIRKRLLELDRLDEECARHGVCANQGNKQNEPTH